MYRFVLLIALILPAPVLAEGTTGEGPEWELVADVDTVQIVTENDDGTRRNTTVWLAVVDEQGYVRTGGSSWGKQVKADPDVELRIGEDTYALRALFVEDPELRERITDAFREKYGFADVLASVVRGSNPLIMRLTSR